MKGKNFLLGILLIVCLATTAFAQKNIVSGVVRDSLTQEVIPFANVFFANTSIGVNSGSNGVFKLQNFPAGKYDLTVTAVGYKTYQQSLEFDGSEFTIDVSLAEVSVKLSEIVVQEDTTGWAQNYSLFKMHFLGSTQNAASCKILNPKSIHLYFDPKLSILVAHSKEPIQIENEALGYKIDYYLSLFELNFKTGRLYCFGLPAFHDLSPKKPKQLKKWTAERERAYYGSLTHFVRALRDDRWAKDGFEVRHVNQVPNPERPTTEFLENKLKQLRSDILSSGDSLEYYSKLKTKPETVEQVSVELARTADLIDTAKYIAKKGVIAITYKKEKEEVNYLATARRSITKSQDSRVQFLNPVKLYANGYYENVQDLFVENYWAWSEKIGDMLPLNYSPAVEKK